MEIAVVKRFLQKRRIIFTATATTDGGKCLTLVLCCGMISVYRVWERQRRLIFRKGGGAHSCSLADLDYHYFPLFSLHSSSTELSVCRLPALLIVLLLMRLSLVCSLRLILSTRFTFVPCFFIRAFLSTISEYTVWQRHSHTYPDTY